ncbi:hypothetical protein [Methylorubrum extorquens]
MSEPTEGGVILALLQEGTRLGLEEPEADLADLRQVMRDPLADLVGKIGVDDRALALLNVLDVIAQPEPDELQ